MTRGNRRGDIVLDDQDRRRFEETLAEVVEASGWVLYGWALMGNHYHFLFQTPEPNLVRGMSWFQTTWTQRFNRRHHLWGHLFGGRYKAKLVEDGEYLNRLIAYVHLNPVRAGLVKKRDGVESYQWSSLPDYVKAPSKRRPWVAVARGLENLEFPDTVAGRRRHLEWIEGCVDWKSPGMAGDALDPYFTPIAGRPEKGTGFFAKLISRECGSVEPLFVPPLSGALSRASSKID